MLEDRNTLINKGAISNSGTVNLSEGSTYIKDDTTTEILSGAARGTFTVVSAETNKTEESKDNNGKSKDNNDKSKENTLVKQKKTTPVTGDDNNQGLWLLFILASGLVMTGLSVYKRREINNK